MESETQLIANKAAYADEWKREKINNIALMLNAAMAAQGRVGLMLNVRKANLDKVLSVLPATRALGGLAHSLPRTTALLYDVVASRRQSFGRLVGQDARRRADDLLEGASATTAAQLEARSRSQG